MAGGGRLTGMGRRCDVIWMSGGPGGAGRKGKGVDS